MKIGSTGTWMVGSVMSLALLAAGSTTAGAQAGAPLIPVHGHVNNALGQAIGKGEIKFSTDRTGGPERKYQYTFPVDTNGDFKGAVPPGDYIAIVYLDAKSIDYLNVSLKKDSDGLMNFDETREEYLKSMSPEDKKNLEEMRKKNAGAQAYNEKVKDLNKTMLTARSDAKAGNTAQAIKSMQDATVAKPDEVLLWVTLGDVQLTDATNAAKAAKAAKTSSNTPELLQKFADAAASYQKGIDLSAAATKKTAPDVLGATYMNQGEALAREGKFKEANDSYDLSVKTQPSLAAQAYFNEAATLYNAGKLDESGAAADKAIAADPKRADAYYIKGQSLIPKATVDAKTQKIVAPAGCVEAYQMYLELDPTGVHAGDVKELLTGIGQPIKNSFRAGKK